ncbi:unnamed protein product, partial [Amoebophrya sp. A120]
ACKKGAEDVEKTDQRDTVACYDDKVPCVFATTAGITKTCVTTTSDVAASPSSGVIDSDVPCDGVKTTAATGTATTKNVNNVLGLACSTPPDERPEAPLKFSETMKQEEAVHVISSHEVQIEAAAFPAISTPADREFVSP